MWDQGVKGSFTPTVCDCVHWKVQTVTCIFIRIWVSACRNPLAHALSQSLRVNRPLRSKTFCRCTRDLWTRDTCTACRPETPTCWWMRKPRPTDLSLQTTCTHQSETEQVGGHQWHLSLQTTCTHRSETEQVGGHQSHLSLQTTCTHQSETEQVGGHQWHLSLQTTCTHWSETEQVGGHQWHLSLQTTCTHQSETEQVCA